MPQQLSVLPTLVGALNSVPSMQAGQFTTAYNSNSRESSVSGFHEYLYTCAYTSTQTQTHRFKKQSNRRGDSAIKNNGYSSRGTGFNSHPPSDDLKQSITPALGDPIRTIKTHTWYRYACHQNTHKHKINKLKINIKIIKSKF